MSIDDGEGVDPVPASDIHTTIDNIDATLDLVNNTRATLGASQSRFESVISSLQIGIENHQLAIAISF